MIEVSFYRLPSMQDEGHSLRFASRAEWMGFARTHGFIDQGNNWTIYGLKITDL